MARREEFAVELNGAPVRASLDLPERKERDREKEKGKDRDNDREESPFAAVLLCHGLPAINDGTARLYAEITDALVESGVAVATILGGSAGARGARLAVESVDDAAAVFHGLALREELDLNRLGVLGHSLGGIVAASLSKRTDQIERLCLLAPVTAKNVMARLAGDAEEEVVARLGGTEVPPGYFDGLDSLTPTEDAAAHDRPTLIMLGAADRVVDLQGSLDYRDAIVAAGHQVDHMLVAMGDHTFSNHTARAACLDTIARFFIETQAVAPRS